MLRFLVLAMVLLPTSLLAGGPVDPDWPCIQRRQPQLSIAQVWSGPLPDAAVEERARAPDVQRLAEVIALRRTSAAEAEALLGQFAAAQAAAGGADAQAQAMTAVFLASFERIQSARDRVMSGIVRYAHKQEALDQHIELTRSQFAQLSAVESPDFDQLDKLEQDIDWSTRIFQDRQQSLTYVCEAPVILEQRAFSLGRLIVAATSQ